LYWHCERAEKGLIGWFPAARDDQSQDKLGETPELELF